MPFRYRLDVITALREKGYTSYKIRKEALINQTALQKIREGKMIAWDQFATVCRLLQLQPGDVIELVPEAEEAEESE